MAKLVIGEPTYERFVADLGLSNHQIVYVRRERDGSKRVIGEYVAMTEVKFLDLGKECEKIEICIIQRGERLHPLRRARVTHFFDTWRHVLQQQFPSPLLKSS